MTNLNDNSSNDNDTPVSMIDFGKGMQTMMESFKTCTERIKIKNSKVMSHNIKETKIIRDIFREFVKDSLKFNGHLENYSLDVLFFVKCFKDPNNYSDYDISILCEDLLEKSRNNYEQSKELKDKIRVEEGSEESGIYDKLIKIQNSLLEHKTNIQNEIKSDKKSALVPKGGGLISACSRYIISLFFDVKDLYLKLEESAMVKVFDKNISSIIVEIGKIETFWDMQVKRIEYLINNLQSGRNIKRSRIVHNLEQKWKNVEKECQIYNRVMKELLVKDGLVSIMTRTPLKNYDADFGE
ncbi:hypothetical protein C1645_880413 [Glomus cerebriforme]|uniref:Uncharacterized protein n=1 Tax=Glomus cerebriforme TaxID=658196 RepID=A0A397SH86_9GLOM|nr:hypothetical protein C1645_880413 [Glomus cerebriforme]